ncbi:MAG TPA: IPT/TIG domain-containing protein [Bryobacteraceae bacterium]|nr:IPT/TIG domain-containing protein [Bryobacteraceae bacterium]
MKHASRLFLLCFAAFGSAGLLPAQILFCATSATPSLVRAEGITERIGDLLFNCTGPANAAVTANFTVALNTNVTNRISSGNTLTGIVFTIDNGSGPQPVLPRPELDAQNILTFNGVALSFSPQGTAELRLAGIRANASGLPPGEPVLAQLAVTAAEIFFSSNQLTVATPEVGLFAELSSALVCAQYGSPLPDNLGFANLTQAKTSFASARVTEGFAGALNSRSTLADFNAQTGDRIIARYAGFPQDARLFVPDVVAGSDAIQATAGGDFGVPASGGAYAPSASGSLLLARVAGADPNGAGGAPVYTPGAPGSSTVTFDSVSELQIVDGSAYVVYEVIDSNVAGLETAQFPTFLGLLPDGNRSPAQTTEQISFAPVSSDVNASATAPVPRFMGSAPPDDCAIHGECVSTTPQVQVQPGELRYNAAAGSVPQIQSFTVRNIGGGMMPWAVSVSYIDGSGWLSLNAVKGTNDYTIQVYAVPGKLQPGTYRAEIKVNAADAGTGSIPVSLVIGPGPAGRDAVAQVPQITGVVNAASFADVPVVPGSLTTIMGSAFAGKNVSAAFDGTPAQIIFSSATQINLLVPSELAAKDASQLVVTVDGSNSAPHPVQVSPFEPAIFEGAILNQDSTVNSAANGAAPGSVIALWATGLSGAGVITGHIHDRDIAVPYYAGPAPGLTGVQQVNLLVPSDLPPMTTEMYVCGAPAGGSKVCSLPAPLTIR